MYTIHKAKQEDAKAIQEVLQKTWKATYKDVKEFTNGFTSDESINQLAEAIRKGFNIQVAKDNSKVVGIASASNGELRQLYVLPKYQGQGIGLALMARYEVSSVYVANYVPAVDFYKKNGFKIVREEVRTFESISIPTYYMTKKKFIS